MWFQPDLSRRRPGKNERSVPLARRRRSDVQDLEYETLIDCVNPKICRSSAKHKASERAGELGGPIVKRSFLQTTLTKNRVSARARLRRINLRGTGSGTKKVFEINAIFFPVSLLEPNHQLSTGERNLQAANGPQHESVLCLTERDSTRCSH